ncbi:hypothetical protein [Streptomyces sp. CB01881]|uniref:hypothetical protein n=1 Tax=Streptomyces sp. CB01881 TaxID=2078691 RepID=UPI0011E00257|nr:hypothetical protein [Streptomyces sp. CB01881]TYC76192.1 hypothetical protein EH183_00630 [Streptomyces sp. CB01881]
MTRARCLPGVARSRAHGSTGWSLSALKGISWRGSWCRRKCARMESLDIRSAGVAKLSSRLAAR